MGSCVIEKIVLAFFNEVATRQIYPPILNFVLWDKFSELHLLNLIFNDYLHSMILIKPIPNLLIQKKCPNLKYLKM